MTKERARKRAKAKAGEKANKRAAQAAQPDTNMPSGKFDAGNNSIKRPGGATNNSNFAEARRGAARSR